MHACMCKHTSMCVCNKPREPRGGVSPLVGPRRMNKPREPRGGVSPLVGPRRMNKPREPRGGGGGGRQPPGSGSHTHSLTHSLRINMRTFY